jgi:hypothetical protein
MIASVTSRGSEQRISLFCKGGTKLRSDDFLEERPEQLANWAGVDLYVADAVGYRLGLGHGGPTRRSVLTSLF